jgi:hypothetical protein
VDPFLPLISHFAKAVKRYFATTKIYSDRG